MITIATMFTIARILLTPLIIWLIIGNYFASALVLFVIAASTDFIDGFIARHYNQKTLFGACLDPIADKILVSFSFLTLFYTTLGHVIIPVWFLYMLIGKELLQVIGAIVLYMRCGFSVIEAKIWGKFATVIQIISIIYILSINFMKIPYNNAVLTILFICMAIIMIITFVHYGYIWLERLKNKD